MPSPRSGESSIGSIGAGGQPVTGSGAPATGAAYRLPSSSGDLSGTVVARHVADDLVDLIDALERDRLEQLHLVVAEPRHRAHAIHGPGDQVARTRLLRGQLAHVALAFEAIGVVRRELDATSVRVHDQRARREAEDHLVGSRLQLEAATSDAGSCPVCWRLVIAF